MNRVLLDTNAYSALMLADSRVQTALNEADEVLVPVTVLGELEAGFRGGACYEKNRAILSSFLGEAVVRVMPTTADTARIYGFIKSGLVKRGTPVPTNDIWIAAVAVETQATLITFDHHFNLMPEVALWSPSANRPSPLR